MLNGKNSSKFNKKSNLLIALTAFLAILYFLSFTRSCSQQQQDKREKVKTALVNQKYKDSINYITLQDATGSLELHNYNGFWTLQRLSDYVSSQVTEPASIPVSPERINSFLDELIKVRNLYKISDKITKNSSLGLSNGTEFHIGYAVSGSEGKDSFRELIFGNQDFSLTSRYMMTGENPQVYEIDDSLDAYLTTSIQSWAEPYIISHTAADTKDIQSITIFKSDSNGTIKSARIADSSKLLDLRHGGLPSLSEYETLETKSVLCKIQIENGDKTSEELTIYDSDNQNETSYIVKVLYKNATGNTSYTSCSKISGWTFNRILDLQ